MAITTTKIKELSSYHSHNIPEAILCADEPVVFRGMVKDWPLVQAGLRSDADADAYLRQFYTGKPVVEYFGSAGIAGRYFYNHDLSALNFDSHRIGLDSVLDKLAQQKNGAEKSFFYVGSSDVDFFLPGLRAENDLAIPGAIQNLMVSLWIGNQSRIPAHWDSPDNLACCVVGQRRFTLFPPSQISNLYVGPLDFTPAGQSTSLVDFANPDLEKHPRFREAIEHAKIAELDAGDVLFIPSMWWHHVEGLCNFNALINYWWRKSPAYMGQAVNVLKHAMLSIRDLPEKEKMAWKHLFDHYIFGDADLARDHIPDNAQGFLAPMDDLNARQLRSWLINKLNR